MARSRSPLRYPGGKSSLATVTTLLIQENGLGRAHYVEPYAGGASLALHLLFNRQVSNIHLNDIDPGIWSFWKSVLDETGRLVEMIERVDVSVKEWMLQKEIYREADTSDPLKLGFATFFLNRTNRSGIIGSGGIIGGLKQEGNYKIDCRFNKAALIEKINKISHFRRSIKIYKKDAIDFIKHVDCKLGEKCLYMIDPPYFEKGSSLYTNFYAKSDHKKVADAISNLQRPWIVTYDNCEDISSIYSGFRQMPFGIQYSANLKRVGKELMILSDNLNVSPNVLEALDSRPSRKAA